MILSSYKEVLGILADTIKQQAFDMKFRGDVLQPLFKRR